MRKISLFTAAVLVFGFISAPGSASADIPAMISTANYPVGMDEDSNGNIFIASENNENADKIGLLVVPKNTGTLFGQSVTAGVEFRLFNQAAVRGVAVDANNDLIISVDGGKIFALTSTARTVYGISVPANTVTELFSNSKFNGPLQFDSVGNLFGIDGTRNQISALTTAPKTLFGVSVPANAPTVISTITNGWFWDLSVDLADNILISYGFTDDAGVWMLPKATGTSYGQSVTANTFVKLDLFNPYFASGTAGMDVDSSGNVYVATWGQSVSVYTPNGFSRFGQNFAAGSVTKILRTKYGRTDQGVAVLADGNLITGGGDGVFLIKDDSTEPAVRPLNLASTDSIFESGYVNESNQSYASWGAINPSDSTVTKFNQRVVDGTEGGGFDAVTNKTWLMGKDCKFYSLDQNDLAAPVLEFTFATGYGTECWGFASRNDGTALVTTDGVSNRSKLFVIDLATGTKVNSDPLNDLLLQDDCLAIALRSNGDIWVSSNQSWNLHKVNPADGSFTDSIPFWDRVFAGITSMDFDSNDNLIGVYFGLSEGTVSINMSAADPMATAILNETTDRYGWTSHAIWVRKNFITSFPNQTQNQTPTVNPIPTQSLASNSASSEVLSSAQNAQQIIPKFRFAKGASKLSTNVKNALRSKKSAYLNSRKITIVASAGLLAGVPIKNARNFALKRAEVLKAFLGSLGVPLSRIEIQLQVVKIGVIPKTELLFTP